MLEFIQTLKQRYHAMLTLPNPLLAVELIQQRVEQLTLAEAMLRKGKLVTQPQPLPLQIAVIGPTQAGKSSVVNMLLNSSLAGVSALAGYTVHPQGFTHRVRAIDCHALQQYFGCFQRVPREQLSHERYDCYALTDSNTDAPLLPACVLWDTPDFDSIASNTYREGVLRAIALADVVVLVVSKEKYADQSVWDMMSTLAALQQPTLICLNKINAGSEAALLASLEEKWHAARSDAFPAIVPLPYQKTGGLPVWPKDQPNLLIQLGKRVNHRQQAQLTQALLQHHWLTWLEPVRLEHQRLATWHNLIDEQRGLMLAHYQRDYLNHPLYYETFQHTLAELLVLLEIPGIAGFMTGARKALTWPMRQIMHAGRKRLHIADSSYEVKLLPQLAGQLLTQLAGRVTDYSMQDSHGAWWQALNQQLHRQRVPLLADFNHAATHYHVTFQQYIESTAQNLYDKLQQQPLVLNSLRATRTTADALMIALTLHTGGIGVHDLIIAPAMLAVTSLLAESAMGGYINSVRARLKTAQLTAVQQQLVDEALCEKLHHLPNTLTSPLTFNISPEQLQAMEQHFTRKRHGLRLL